MTIVKISRKLHKWLMLLVGVQMLIWAATGTYMVVMNIDYIHGDSLVRSHQDENMRTLLDISQVKFNLVQLKLAYPQADEIHLKMLQQQAVYQFRNGKRRHLVNATTGILLADISKAQAQTIAQTHYTGKGNIVHTKFLTQVNGEISARILPVWRIEFADMAAPRLYVSTHTGELVTKRHDYWVLFDWFFCFHIMDYGEDGEVSNVLLLIIALISLLACLSGVVLTYVSFVKVGGKSIQTPKNDSAMRVMPWIRYIHRCLSLLVFIQLFIWLVTGLYFNLMDNNKASGNQNRQRIVENTQQFNTDKLFPIATIVKQNQNVLKVSLISRLDRPFYLVTEQQGLYDHFPRKQFLVDAINGNKVAIDKGLVESIAKTSYSGKADIDFSIPLTPLIIEIPKQKNPLWKINFNDKLNTSVYIDKQNAGVVAHVDDDKRLANLMFKLHFMDYHLLSNITASKIGGFNNIQIIVLALLTLLFALTGMYWLTHLIMHKQFRW